MRGRQDFVRLALPTIIDILSTLRHTPGSFVFKDAMEDYTGLQIGLLAIQGDFEMHQHQVRLLGATPHLVKLPKDLTLVDALIMPGGESTTMSIMIDRFKLRQPLIEFGLQKPVYGTCAGMIMLAKKITDNISSVEPLGLMDIDVERNGYGRQIFSFEQALPAPQVANGHPLTATFIRAPKIVRLGPDVESLLLYQQVPVLVRQGHLLAASFHTELGSDTTLLKYFFDHFFARQSRS
jgi:pyridoxal 5'-phosphate synthase pdxT subunit